VRYSVTPDPVQDVMSGLMPKRMIDRMFGRGLGLIN
jgi:hypothetical protein